jgi:hypothetical protein
MPPNQINLPDPVVQAMELAPQLLRECDPFPPLIVALDTDSSIFVDLLADVFAVGVSPETQRAQLQTLLRKNGIVAYALMTKSPLFPAVTIPKDFDANPSNSVAKPKQRLSPFRESPQLIIDQIITITYEETHQPTARYWQAAAYRQGEEVGLDQFQELTVVPTSGLWVGLLD